MNNGLRIPGFMMHLIDRPLRHVPLVPVSPGTIDGYVLMEFNKQFFRSDICVPYVDHCSHCGHKDMDVKKRYAEAVEKAVQKISRMVNSKVREMLKEALIAVGKD